MCGSTCRAAGRFHVKSGCRLERESSGTDVSAGCRKANGWGKSGKEGITVNEEEEDEEQLKTFPEHELYHFVLPPHLSVSSPRMGALPAQMEATCHESVPSRFSTLATKVGATIALQPHQCKMRTQPALHDTSARPEHQELKLLHVRHLYKIWTAPEASASGCGRGEGARELTSWGRERGRQLQAVHVHAWFH